MDTIDDVLLAEHPGPAILAELKHASAYFAPRENSLPFDQLMMAAHLARGGAVPRTEPTLSELELSVPIRYGSLPKTTRLETACEALASAYHSVAATFSAVGSSMHRIRAKQLPQYDEGSIGYEVPTLAGKLG